MRSEEDGHRHRGQEHRHVRGREDLPPVGEVHHPAGCRPSVSPARPPCSLTASSGARARAPRPRSRSSSRPPSTPSSRRQDPAANRQARFRILPEPGLFLSPGIRGLTLSSAMAPGPSLRPGAAGAQECLLSSVGQSTALVKRGSSVRIRQGAPQRTASLPGIIPERRGFVLRGPGFPVASAHAGRPGLGLLPGRTTVAKNQTIVDNVPTVRITSWVLRFRPSNAPSDSLTGLPG